MECRYRISGSDVLTTLCYSLQSLVTQILREDLEGTFKLRVDIYSPEEVISGNQ